MTELLSRFAPGEFIGLVAVTGGLLCGLMGIVMGIWYQVRQVEIAAALKRDMLDRGMSPDEIKTVVEAGSPRSKESLPKYASCEV
jgi:hypothetical protein